MDEWKLSPLSFLLLLLLLPLSSSSIGLFSVPMQFDHDYMKQSSSVVDPNLIERRIRLPGLDHVSSDEDLGHYAGYFKLPRSYDARLFYYFFESRNKNKDAPVFAWFNGGPACSSSVAVFIENGPFRIDNNNLTLSWNEYGWDQVSNIIYVDQPIGTGFSYSNDKRDIGRCSDDQVVNDLYDFLQAFFNEHPQLANNEFYISGKSYAGHINPALATRIIQGNRVKQGLHINLKGIAMGNVLINPSIEHQAYADYAFGMGMINRSVYDRINKLLPACNMGINLCETGEAGACVPTYWFCLNTVMYGVLDAAGDVNYHDIRKKCDEGDLCYDFSNMETYLNQESVKTALGVPKGLEFSVCNSRVDDMMLPDRMKNMQPIIQDLLDEGVKVLVYAGEYSFYLNYLGNWRWVHAMEWSGHKYFITAPQVGFDVDGHKFGALKSYGPLTFLKVYDAGNFVPMDQPKAALEMMKRWTQGTL